MSTSECLNASCCESDSMSTQNSTYNYRIHILPPYGYNILAVLLTMVLVFGSFINGAGLIMFIKNRHLRSPTNIFILNLAAADFLMCSVGSQLSMYSSYYHKWMFGDIGCRMEGFVVYFIALTQMYTLMAISIDRYIVISSPLWAAKLTKPVAWISCALCWGGGLFWAVMPLFGWSIYRLEGAMISCSIAFETDILHYQAFTVTIFFFCLILPLAVMMYSYIQIFLTVSKDLHLTPTSPHSLEQH